MPHWRMMFGVFVFATIGTPDPRIAAQVTTQVNALLASVAQCAQSATFERSIAAGRPVDRLPDVSRSAWIAEAACWADISRRAELIPAAALQGEERITLETLRWESGLQKDRAPHWWVDFSSVTPYASPVGYIARGLGSYAVSTPADTTLALRQLRMVPALIDSIRTGLEQRAARNIRLAREALPASTALMEGFAVRGGANPFAVVPARVARLDEATRNAFLTSAAQVVDGEIVPTAERLVTLLKGGYAVKAPAQVGLSQYPGGAAYYRWLVRWHTTVNTTPESVHAIGVREVARIEREMAATRAEIGFTGTAAEFHAQLAKDPKLFATTPEAFGERLMSHARRLEPMLDRAFAIRPRARGDVQRLPAALEPAMTFGYYQTPTAGDSMGHYLYNGTKLSERSMLGSAALIAHELWPGHHFQINLALENTGLPPYRKGYYTAFGEGWGDYASIVAGELGLYADPTDRYGRLAMDMFLSCRLVVDTGMNALGWSRERAMSYMRSHILESETQIRSESLRYSTDLPGQALAYKMGSNEFVRLRTRAQQVLGAQFDLRRFHEQVLSSGSLPMTVLGAKVDRWVQTSR